MVIPQAGSRSSTQRRRRHRQRRHRGTRCITVDVNQGELDALVLRGYLSEDQRGDVDSIKKAIEGVLSDIVFELSFSPMPLSAVELASDRSIRRNASQVEEQFQALRITAATTATLSDGNASQGCACLAS
jgi:hypothetical protein